MTVKSLETVVTKLKYHNPKFLESKKINDLDDILFEFQQELVTTKEISESNSKQVLFLRATVGEFKNMLKVFASGVSLFTKNLSLPKKRRYRRNVLWKLRK